MAQEKKEGLGILELPQELIASISCYAAVGKPEQSLSNLSAAHRIFGHNLFQKDRILSKLTMYGIQGNINRVASLHNNAPGLRLEVLFTLAGLGAQDEIWRHY